MQAHNWKVGKIDCQSQSILCDHLSITNYPTLSSVFNKEMRLFDSHLNPNASFFENWFLHDFGNAMTVDLKEKPSSWQVWALDVENQSIKFQRWAFYRIWPVIEVTALAGFFVGTLFALSIRLVCCRSTGVKTQKQKTH